MKVKNILVIVTIISLLSTIVTTWYGLFQKSEAERYKNNYELSVTKQTEYKDKNGILVREVQNLVLTKQDLQNSKDSSIRKLLIELANSDIKLRKVESLGYVNSNSNYAFKASQDTSWITMWTDSVCIDTVKLYTSKFDNKWISYWSQKKSNSDSTQVEIKTNHEMLITESWYKEGSWKLKNLFSWRAKKYKTSCKDLNPYTNIIDIKIVKKGRKNE